MAKVSTYLNFDGQTEEAFEFYKKVFKTSFVGELQRMESVPAQPGMKELSDAEKKRVMHVALPITGGHVLMGTDILPSMGHRLEVGNNMYITLEPDTREEADELFASLSDGGKVEMKLQEMFWGDYFGSFQDRYGINWMINCSEKKHT